MHPSYHIVIADDDDGVRAVLARVVVRLYPNVSVSAARDGTDAFAVLQQRGADLLITNNDMPNMNGIDLVQAVRALHLTMPIIMVSGNTNIEQHVLAIGVTQFVAKPFSTGQIAQILMKLLAP